MKFLRPRKSTAPIWLAVAVATAGMAPVASAEEPPSWLDRVLFNPQERTESGAVSLEAGDTAAAAGAMDSALRLAPEDARAQYNAGTAGLAFAPDRAKTLLEQAAGADGDVAAKAAYNLGNLQLESGELQPAIESYKQALRRDPDFEDAKFNLELAQRRLQEQQQNQDQQNQDSQDQQNQDQQDQDSQDQQGDQDSEQDQQDQNQNSENQDGRDQEQQDQDEEGQDPENQDEGQEEQNQQSGDSEQDPEQNQDPQDREGGQDQPQGQDQQESPLPQFENLPDMTAQEAAAILEAIENLEREQRRQQAVEAAAEARRSGKKDW
ncbi:MAG: tetratricopeptide repeat protein [Acidobacteriota bacterium]